MVKKSPPKPPPPPPNVKLKLPAGKLVSPATFAPSLSAPPPGKAPLPPAGKGSKLRPPPPLDSSNRGEEHRQFPRARLAVRFTAWIDQGNQRTFEATFTSTNLSVSGAFLESTFFLPVGTEMRVSFELDEDEEPVQARATIIREERSERGSSSQAPTGFGIRFVEFYGQSEVTLAKLFIGEQLREFAESYLSSKRAKSLNSELDRVIDALAAWELQKVTSPQDTWREK
ncbi:MAG: PilZ domain-containing protein [Myxococcaceae bacterium]